MSIPHRSFGSKPDQVSAIALGGVTAMGLSRNEAEALLKQCLDAGLNYVDVAPTYGDAEDVLGPVVKPHRDRTFIACKTTERSAEGAQRELDSSLTKMQTDHFDLYQLHSIASIEDVEKAFALGGAMEVLLKARDAGKVRYLGFSAHNEEAGLLALEKFDFDSILTPLNFFSFNRGGYGQRLVPRAREKGCAVMSLKAMARRAWPEGATRWSQNTWYEPFQDKNLAELALRWALCTLEADVAMPPGDPTQFQWALEFGQRLAPLTELQLQTLADFEPDEKPLFPLPG